MRRATLVVLVAFVLVAIEAIAQERTIGLLLKKEGSFEGYTLFSPMLYTTTYLVNNDGLLVHSWESDYLPGLTAYLSEDGYLYRVIVPAKSSRFNGVGGGVEKLDWDGNIVWHYEYCTDEYRQNHDIKVMPSGNVLMIAWEYKDYTESIAAGRDPATLHQSGLWPDYIIEVEPVGDSGGNIVWEWHVWDHLIQDFDSAKDNYGVVSDNPGLIDLNYVELPRITDWTHLNSVTYNEELDQIILASHYFSEIWVIDHSTTTDEARGHTGGRYGKGGDILYRWGNPNTYTTGDQKFFSAHDAQWIDPELPGAGNILVFNNGSEIGYSSVDEIVPPVDEYGNYSLVGQTYGPEDPAWSYTDYVTLSLIFSGVQRMPNGNTLICYGPQGLFVEVTPEGDEVWRYINPVIMYGPLYQGQRIPILGANSVFKIRRYAPDFPGFAGKDLTPNGPIEKYDDAVKEGETITRVKLKPYPNPFTHSATVTYKLGAPGHVQIKIYNVLGQEVRTLVDALKPAGNHEVAWNGTDNLGQRLSPGVYFCTLKTGKSSFTERIILVR